MKGIVPMLNAALFVEKSRQQQWAAKEEKHNSGLPLVTALGSEGKDRTRLTTALNIAVMVGVVPVLSTHSVITRMHSSITKMPRWRSV